MKRLVLTIAILIGLAAPAWAGYDEGVAAYKRGDYATALREFRPLAKQGEAIAQSYLGFMYYNGKGVPQDYAKAVRWYRKAAEQGDARAQNILGAMYHTGEGVPQDYAEAVRWFRKATKQGNAHAQHNLGVAYDEGRGVPQDYAEAVRWYRKSAQQGHAGAQSNLGLMYYESHGVPQVYAEAVKWFREAAEQGHAPAQYSLGRMYLKGQGIPKNYVLAHLWFNLAAAGGINDAVEARENMAVFMTPAQIAEAQRLARLWSPNRKLPFKELKVARTPPPRQQPTPRASRAYSTGTGFYVTRAGHLLTNEHVISGCRKVTLQTPGKQRHDAQIIGRDKANDLALLKTDAKTGHVAVIRSGRSIRPGNEIVSFGFPLSGYLSSRGNLTVGRISALAGLGDDTRLLQITAPIQKGNSGGPILDLSGNVVGVVVSKLAALKFAKATGAIPQNVNFAIKRRLVEEFLDANDVSYTTGPAGRRLDPSEVGEIAKKFTVKVECWR